MIKILATILLLLTTCSDQASFYGKGQEDNQVDTGRVPIVWPPLMVEEPSQKPGQDCEEDLQKLRLKYATISHQYRNLQYKYRKLYRRHSYHMKKYHYD